MDHPNNHGRHHMDIASSYMPDRSGMDQALHHSQSRNLDMIAAYMAERSAALGQGQYPMPSSDMGSVSTAYMPDRSAHSMGQIDYSTQNRSMDMVSYPPETPTKPTASELSMHGQSLDNNAYSMPDGSGSLKQPQHIKPPTQNQHIETPVSTYTPTNSTTTEQTKPPAANNGVIENNSFEADRSTTMEQAENTSQSQNDMVSSYIPELPNSTELFQTSLPLLRTTFESAKFWLRCAENACQRTAQYDQSIGQDFQTSVQAGLNQFLAVMKEASQKCIDDATKYLPDLSLNPASLMPPIEDDEPLDDGNDTYDVKPDPKSLQQAMQLHKSGRPKRERRSKDEEITYDETYDDMTIDDDDNDIDYEKTMSRNVSRNLRKKKKTRKRIKIADDFFKCEECLVTFENNEDLLSHIELVHNDKTSLVCPLCSKSYSTPRAVKKHINEVHNKRKVCNICGKKFAYKYELNNHLKKHMEKEPKKEPDISKTFSCQICGYHANRAQHVKSHIRFKHQEWIENGGDVNQFLEEVMPDGTRVQKEGDPNAVGVNDVVGDFTCMVCNVNFKTKKILHSHLKTHLDEQMKVENEDGSKFQCSKCHKHCTSQKALFSHIKRVHSKSLKCKFCRKTFFARYQLEGHLRVHFNLKPFRCDTCSTKAFPSLTALRIHTRLKHPERYTAKPFKCQKCDVAFTFKAQLDQHNNRTHSYTDSKGTADQDSKDQEVQSLENAMSAENIVPQVKIENVDEDKEQCKKCGRAFSSGRLLWQHIRRVHNKKFTCSTCGKKFGYPGELKDHEMLHTDKHAFACDFCDKKSHTRALIVQHARYVHPTEMQDDTRFPCTVCEAKFPLSVSLSHHMKEHAPQNTDTFSCDICLRNFPTQLRLKTHKMVGHEDDNIEPFKKEGEEVKMIDKISKMMPQDPVMCTKCGLEFPTMDSLSKHKTMEHQNDPKLQCPACDKICHNKEALRNHKRRVHAKKRECSVCDKKFPFQYCLDAHMLTHTGERNFCCQHCRKSFYTIQQLNVHIKLVHSARSFNCDICNAKFGTKQGRDRHVIHRHTNERPQTCEYCGRGFVDRRSLKAHIFIHTRQSDIKCDICGKLYATRSCLNKHIRIKHRGERKLCPICGKHIAGSIAMHLKSHGEKRYKCDQCEKIYAWPQGLKEHLRTHSGDKPYECKICNKRFLGSANFSKHKKIHNKFDDGTTRRRMRQESTEVKHVIPREEPPPSRDPEPDFHNQYQAVMNQSINQLMMNQTMMNPSMMNQSMLNQSMLSQSMMMHGHGHNDINPANLHGWQI